MKPGFSIHEQGPTPFMDTCDDCDHPIDGAPFIIRDAHLCEDCLSIRQHAADEAADNKRKGRIEDPKESA